MNELILELHRQGLTAPAIAERVELSANTVRNALHAAHQTLHPAADRVQAAQRRRAIEDALDHDPTLSTKALAEQLGIRRIYVTRIRKRLGRPGLDRAEQAKRRRSNVALDILAGLSNKEIAAKYGVNVHVIQVDRRAIQAGA
jgi:DNA-binding NarL/FixJ family response regulator